MYERDLCNKLLEMPFFLHHKQCKLFTAWKLYTRKVIYQRRREHFKAGTLFTDEPLISLMREVYGKIYDLQQSVDLFEYCGSGLLNTRNYLQAQEKKLYVEFSNLKSGILEIGELIEARYLYVVSNEYIGVRISEIIVHHPYSMSETSGAGLVRAGQKNILEDVNWENVRSVQRLKAEYKGKIHQVFKCTELMIETMLGSLLLRFFSRLSKSVLGVTIANRDVARAIVGYWAQCDEIRGNKIIYDEKNGEANSLKLPGSLSTTANQMSVLENSNRKPIEESTSRKGRYLTIYFAFFIGNRVLDPDSTFHHKNMSNLRLEVDPSSAQVMHYLHELYGVLGILLSGLPKLKYHPVIYKAEKKTDVFRDEFDIPKANDDTEKPLGGNGKNSEWLRGKHVPSPTPEEMENTVLKRRSSANYNGGSSVLFVHLQNCQILAELSVQQLSVKTLHQVFLCTFCDAILFNLCANSFDLLLPKHLPLRTLHLD